MYVIIEYREDEYRHSSRTLGLTNSRDMADRIIYEQYGDDVIDVEILEPKKNKEVNVRKLYIEDTNEPLPNYTVEIVVEEHEVL